MSEPIPGSTDTTPTASAVSAPVSAPVLATKSLVETAKEVIPEPKKPAGPSQQAIKDAYAVLEAAQKAEDQGVFGIHTDGKRKFRIPMIPRHLGHVTINTTKEIKHRDGRTMEVPSVIEYLPGSEHYLTYSEMQDIQHRMSRLIANETVGRFGEGMAGKVTLNVSGTGAPVFGAHGSRESF